MLLHRVDRKKPERLAPLIILHIHLYLTKRIVTKLSQNADNCLWRLDGRPDGGDWVLIRNKCRDFVILHSYYTCLGALSATYPTGTEGYFSGMIWSMRETDSLLASEVEV
jgi:hypothetical protein